MKKRFILALATLAIFSFLFKEAQATQYKYVKAKSPIVTDSLKPAIAKYKQQNYIGAMQDLEEILQKEPKNMTGIYYLALAYTQLGYQDKARQLYEIVSASSKNEVLKEYSTKAMACLDSPESPQCKGIDPNAENNENQGSAEPVDEMEAFIKSGVKIHPTAMDAITNERMIRKIQEQEYLRKQQEQNNPNPNLKTYNSSPTNEEIISAISTLSKIGYNIFENPQLGYLNEYSDNNNYLNQYSPSLSLNNSEYAKMMLLNQMTQYNNITNSYGI